MSIGKQEHVIHLGCWNHGRRKFVDADRVCANKGNGLPAEFVKLINKLYKIEREIKQASAEKRRPVATRGVFLDAYITSILYELLKYCEPLYLLKQ